jgi:hypothetical protein
MHELGLLPASLYVRGYSASYKTRVRKLNILSQNLQWANTFYGLCLRKVKDRSTT